MFEFSVAKKYLIPRRKQLSRSLIAALSVLVISLVVWLLLLFLSVMQGIEKGWLDKLTSLNAPLRITPTEEYFASYYYQIDGLSAASHYTPKSIAEKAKAPLSDPYAPEEDRELPAHLPARDLFPDGTLKDPVKSAYAILKQRKELTFQEFEITGGMMRLKLLRVQKGERALLPSYLTQVCYIASLPEKNPHLPSLLIPPSGRDMHNLEVQKIKTSLKQNILPEAPGKGVGVLLPKSFQENGVLIGDSGYVSYPAATSNALQEQRFPIFVAGFYDPGIMAVGMRSILAPASLVQAVSSSSGAYTFDKTASSGIQIWFQDLKSAGKMKKELETAFAEAGIEKYWKITTFREYDFAKDLFQQFQSDRYLFTLLGIIILIVGCSNIISLLVLLVSDKKREIGILQAMGASTRSIATIFAFCGMTLGIVSCLIGTGAALLTLHHIDKVVGFLSFLQGHEMFNAAFYGASLPNALSRDALLFVAIATPLISLFAGLVPALKACRLRPSEILRSE